MNHRPPHAGQGLLETIIGIGVILAGTVGSITLISQTIKFGRTTNNRVIAASLAREGIEVVRNIRDTNWLKIQANEDKDPATPEINPYGSFDGLFDVATSVHDSIPVFTQSLGNGWTLFPLPAGPDSNCGVPPSWKCKQVFENTDGFYQRSAGALPPTASRFKRWLRLDPICRDDADGDGFPDDLAVDNIVTADGVTCAAGSEVLVGLKVTSTVTWGGNNPGSFTLEDLLYNWKYVK